MYFNIIFHIQQKSNTFFVYNIYGIVNHTDNMIQIHIYIYIYD